MKFRKGQELIDIIRRKKKHTNTPPLYSTDSTTVDIYSVEYVSNFKKQAWCGDSAKIYEEIHEKIYFQAVTLNYFTEHIKPTDKVLDVGAGTGRLSLPIARLGCNVVASDISESMLEIINLNKGDLNIKTLLSEGAVLPIEDSSFDAVVSMDFLVHVPEWQNLVKEKARVTKDGGYIIFSAYNGDNLKYISQTRDPKVIADRYIGGNNFVTNPTQEEYEKFCAENNLELVKIQPFNLFTGTAYLCDQMTLDEITQFRTLFSKAIKNPKYLDIIKEIENKIIKELPHECCTHVIVVLKKKYSESTNA